MKIIITFCICFLLAASAFGQVSLRIADGTTLDVAGAMEIVLKGNWENDGTFSPGEGIVTFNGSADQSIAGSSAENYFNMALEKSTGALTLETDIIIHNSLILNAGQIFTGNHTLQLGDSSEAVLLNNGGSISGNLLRYINNISGPRVFPVSSGIYNRPLTIDFTVPPNTGGIINVTHIDPGGFSAAIPQLDDNGYPLDRRSAMYWEISMEGISGGEYDLSVDGAGQPGIIRSNYLRILHSTDGNTFNLVGNHQAGDSSIARRSGISGSIADRFYLGGHPLDNPLEESIAFTHSFAAGWNLIGLPLLFADAAHQTLYPSAVEGSLMGFTNGDYTTVDTLRPGEGYFLEFIQPASTPLQGYAYSDLTIDLEADWNLISAGTRNVFVGDIIDPSSIIIPGTIYGFDGAYYPTNMLEPGQAYWIRANTPGQVTLPAQPTAVADAPQRIATSRLNLDQFTSLQIADARGRNQTLYLNVDLAEATAPPEISSTESRAALLPEAAASFAAEQNSSSVGERSRSSTDSPESNARQERLESTAREQSKKVAGETSENSTPQKETAPGNIENFKLPPTPPIALSGLDARFADNLNFSESDEAVIHIQASDYPLTIDVANLAGLLDDAAAQSQSDGDRTDHPEALPEQAAYRYVITEYSAGQKGVAHNLDETASVQINNPQVKTLRISKKAIVPTSFAVSQNYPNPFNPRTEIRYSIPREGKVEIIVYNALGQKVKTLVSRIKKAGSYQTVWDGTNAAGQAVASGVYMYRVTSGKNKAARKMILLR